MAFEFATQCAYGDGNGEPGFINLDRLAVDMAGTETDEFVSGEWFGSSKYKVGRTTKTLLQALHAAFINMDYHYLVNPCGEKLI